MHQNGVDRDHDHDQDFWCRDPAPSLKGGPFKRANDHHEHHPNQGSHGNRFDVRREEQDEQQQRHRRSYARQSAATT